MKTKGILTCAKHDKPVTWIGNRSECSICAAEREIKLSHSKAPSPSHTPGPCTKCFVRYHFNTGCGEIIQCPLHTAAQELLEALKEAEQAMSDVYRENKDIGRNYLSTARSHVREAIAKAEGR